MLSKKALQKFVKTVAKNDLFDADLPYEDFTMGCILSHQSIFVDTRDELQQQKFFPIGITGLFKLPNDLSQNFYFNYTYYNVSYESLTCCSDVPIAFHYMEPQEIISMEYFFYHVHPFGVAKNITEKIGRKLKLDEIILASDKKVFAPNFIEHLDYHNFSSSEMEEG